jgi:hypothetical protein
MDIPRRGKQIAADKRFSEPDRPVRAGQLIDALRRMTWKGGSDLPFSGPRLRVVLDSRTPIGKSRILLSSSVGSIGVCRMGRVHFPGFSLFVS